VSGRAGGRTFELASQAEIRCSPERIFDLIADFDGYASWLTGSSAYHGTHDVTANPVQLGTTYREPGPFGVRHGEVIELERPTRITFHQPMTLKLGVGTLDFTVRYVLSAGLETTHVRRVCALGIPRHLRLFEPVVVGQFRAESARTLNALKAYADANPT
jgi:uncharacterized protein YndB with AHSA1/START domain